MTKSFTNTQKVEVEIGELKGSFVIPVMLTDKDLDTYFRRNMESKKKMDDAESAGKPIVVSGTQVQIDARKHMVRSIEFPGVTIENFRNGTRPFPALSQRVIKALEPLIEDALTTPN